MNTTKAVCATLFACVLTAAPAVATTYNLTTQGNNAFSDSANSNAWYESTTYSLNGQSRSAVAGMFRLSGTDDTGATSTFLAFCLQPLETLQLSIQYTLGTSLGTTVLDRLSALMSNALGSVANSSTAAAFQLAAWEIANEGSGALSLNSGAFQLTAASSGATSTAQGWLDAISNGSWQANGAVTILSAPNTQDLLTNLPSPAPVPVPAAGFGLAAGLASLAGFAKRRRRAA